MRRAVAPGAPSLAGNSGISAAGISALVISAVVITALLCAKPALGAETSLELVERLNSDDLLGAELAAVELRKRGRTCLEDLAQILSSKAPFRADDRRLAVRPVFDDILLVLLEELETDLLRAAREKLESERLRKLVERERKEPAEPKPAGDGETPELSENEERLKNLEASMATRGPRLEETSALVRDLMPAGAAVILRRRELAEPFLALYYAELLDRVATDLPPDELLPDTPLDGDSGEAFEGRRHLYAPVWYWIVLTGVEEKPGGFRRPARALELLNRHMDRCFDELDAPDYRVRESAEDAFFVFAQIGRDYLATRCEKPASPCRTLLSLLDWRIHPRVSERTSMDFREYPEMNFRERRRHVIRYARTAGKDAIPTLRRIVHDNASEGSVRVKLTAAEALAGLGDTSAIQELGRRQIPELLKIPEISREFFLLKGIQYQEEEQYELAIEEFRKILDESPFHFAANYRIAFAYLLNKQYKKSIHHFGIARRVRPDDSLTLYNLACAYSLDGQTENGLDALEASIRAGFDDHAHIEQDPDLESLRQSPRYRKLVDELKSAGRDG